MSTPYYPNAYTGTATLQAGPPPFNASTPKGTVKTVQAPYGVQIVRLTDPTDGCSNGGYVTPGGGDATSVPFSPGGLLVDVVCEGVHHIKAFNPQTMQVGKEQFTCVGNGTFSTISQVFYCKLNTSTAMNALWVDPSGKLQSSQVFDWASCPQASKGANWSGYPSVNQGDTLFTEAIGWNGQHQDTARYVFLYSTTTRSCSTVDTIGNGISPIYYSNGGNFPITNLLTGQPLKCTAHVHSTRHSSGWLVTGQNGASGTDCGANNAFLFRLSDMLGYSVGAVPNSGGHATLSSTALYNSGNPAINSRQMETPLTWQTIATFTHPGEDLHISADQSNDNSPLIGSTGGLKTTAWVGPYMNEVLGVDKNGTIYRFTPTWSSGNGLTSFEGAIGITGVSQERNLIEFTSDMECGLGGTLGNCRTDVFVVKVR